MWIKRTLFLQIKEHLRKQEVLTLITGPRQAGKTTLMEYLKDDLVNENKKSVFFNLDITEHKPLFESHERLVKAIQLAIGDDGYVFLDEIQRRENAGLFLKGLYDMKLPYKFIVSGSGSLELKEKIHESLPGRKRIFQLSTLSFEELVNFRTNYQYSYPGKGLTGLRDFFDVYPGKLENFLNEYLNFGGYPRVVLAETGKEKRIEIEDIYRSYLEKDVEKLLGVQKGDSFTNLVRLLSVQAGNMVNVTELSNTLGIVQETVNSYLWYLEKTFIVRKVTPFFRNVRSEISKSPEYYFVDLGLKNFSVNQFGIATQVSPPSGLLFENFVHNLLVELLQSGAATLHFWRTQDKAEVDFVIDTGLKVIPVEVKYRRLSEPVTTRSFQSFIAKYKPKDAYVVHLGGYFQKKKGNTRIHFLPFYELQTLFESV